MASIKKFAGGLGLTAQITNQIRHVERTIQNPGNTDIDPDRRSEDYRLSPQREISSIAYYKQRTEECYCYRRKDVVTLVGIICTMPKDLDPIYEDRFFELTYDFLTQRYGGEKNVITAIVHKDESGQPHMHFLFSPIVEDGKHGGEKICCNEVLTREEYQNFHSAYQKYMDDHGLPEAQVETGITKRQGGNRLVKDMKVEREQQRLSMQEAAQRLRY